MSRVPIREVVLDPSGNVQSNISITVKEVPSGVNATLYLDATSGTTIPNPTTTDGSGRIPGYVDEGAFDLTIGTDPTTIRLNLFDAERNSGLAAALVSQVFT